MTVDELNIIWLDLFENLTYVKKEKILKLFKKGVDIRKNFLTNLELHNILNAQEFKRMSLCLEDAFLNRILKEYEKANVECVTFYDKRYPYLLKEISTPPLCLYCKGNVQLLNTKCIGIVGSRKPTEYGIVVTKQFSKELSKNKLTIVSGLAVGVDTIAHKSALEENGQTIAVLGGGFNNIYPAINTNLAKTIAENNLLISEYSPNISPQTYQFIARNRIIAGLSLGVLITEAGEKSGALKTADFALEFNREIFVVPGRINSDNSKGTNRLIKNLQGSAVTESNDILTTLNIEAENNQNSNVQLDMNAQIILSYVQSEKKTFQEISDYTKIKPNDLNSILMELEMEGLITKLSGNSYIKS